MKFRPCIDLRRGRVVQIVGGTLRAGAASRQILKPSVPLRLTHACIAQMDCGVGM